MRLLASAVAVPLLLAAPGAAASTKPRLTLSGHTFDRGGVLHVAGRDCKNVGLGHGYAFDIEAGERRELGGWTGEDIKPDGTWKADLPLGLQAGRYTLHTACFERTEPNVYYPTETLTILPQRSPAAERRLTVSPATAKAGDRVTVSGSVTGVVFDPGVFLAATRTYVGTIAAGGRGVSGSVRLPSSLDPGTHALVVQVQGDDGGDGYVTLLGTVTVESDEPTPAPTTAAPVVATTPPPAPTPTATPTPEPTTPQPTTAEPTPESTTVLSADEGDGLSTTAVAAAGGAGVLALGATVLVVRRRRVAD